MAVMAWKPVMPLSTFPIASSATVSSSDFWMDVMFVTSTPLKTISDRRWASQARGAGWPSCLFPVSSPPPPVPAKFSTAPPRGAPGLRTLPATSARPQTPSSTRPPTTRARGTAGAGAAAAAPDRRLDRAASFSHSPLAAVAPYLSMAAPRRALCGRARDPGDAARRWRANSAVAGSPLDAHTRMWMRWIRRGSMMMLPGVSDSAPCGKTCLLAAPARGPKRSTCYASWLDDARRRARRMA